MGRKTGNIKYNVRERGRKFVGKDRNLDLRATAALINGDEVQERVKNRDLIGYYGHVIRMKFGIRPPEWVMDDGKQINIEPAVVTTHLSADEEGNITHDTEFLDTDSGAMAERLFNSRTGGFSSAIFAVPRGAVDVPTIFAGFDYVFEPNFTTNRGYMLDSTGDGMDGLMLDAVMSEWTQSTAAMKAIYDSIQREHNIALQAMEKLCEENEELISILSARGATTSNGVILLDSTGEGHSRPMIVGKRGTADFLSRTNAFKTGAIVGFAPLPDDKPASPDDPALAAAHRYYGVKP